MAAVIQVNQNWNDGGAPVYGSFSLNAANLYELDEAVVVTNSGVKHDFGVPVVANIIAFMMLVTGNLVGVSTYTFTDFAALSGAQGAALDTFTLTDGALFTWALGQGTCPMQAVTALLSTKLINGVANANTARFQLRVACS